MATSIKIVCWILTQMLVELTYHVIPSTHSKLRGKRRNSFSSLAKLLNRTLSRWVMACTPMNWRMGFTHRWSLFQPGNEGRKFECRLKILFGDGGQYCGFKAYMYWHTSISSIAKTSCILIIG